VHEIASCCPCHNSQPTAWEGRTNGIEARFNAGLPVQVLRSLFIFNGSFPPRLLKCAPAGFELRSLHPRNLKPGETLAEAGRRFTCCVLDL